MKKRTDGLDLIYKNIRQIIEETRNKVYHTANFAMVQAYWQIGNLIIQAEQNGKQRAEYGTFLLKELSSRLRKEYGKGFDESNLRHMRNFYSAFQIQDAVRPELSWTHYRLLLKVESEEARLFYIQEIIEGNWSTRTLERQLGSLYFERLLMTKKQNRALLKKEVESKKEVLKASDIIKDPYVLEFLNLKSQTDFYEKELEQALIDSLQEFLLELGKGFSFVGRQYRITTEHQDFYIDLVFYNYILKCFLLIDLKTAKLTHQDVGQMDMYVRMFEDKIRQKSDHPTIGLILCSEKDNTIVKYSLLSESKQIFASRYKIYLPTEKQLRQKIESERQVVEIEKKASGKKL